MAQLPVRLDNLIDHVRSLQPDGDALDDLAGASAVAAALATLGDHLVGHFVDRARRSGASWTEIGGRMGVTKQAAQKRFVPREEDLDRMFDGRRLSLFTERARWVVVRAHQEATAMGAAQADSLHIVLGLLDVAEALAARAIEAQGIALDRVREAAMEVLGRRQAVPDDQRPAHLPFAPEAKKLLELTVREALRLGHNYVGTEHMLLALFRDQDAAGTRVLLDLGVDRRRAEEWILHELHEISGRRSPAG